MNTNDSLHKCYLHELPAIPSVVHDHRINGSRGARIVKCWISRGHGISRVLDMGCLVVHVQYGNCRFFRQILAHGFAQDYTYAVCNEVTCSDGLDELPVSVGGDVGIGILQLHFAAVHDSTVPWHVSTTTWGAGWCQRPDTGLNCGTRADVQLGMMLHDTTEIYNA